MILKVYSKDYSKEKGGKFNRIQIASSDLLDVAPLEVSQKIVEIFGDEKGYMDVRFAGCELPKLKEGYYTIECEEIWLDTRKFDETQGDEYPSPVIVRVAGNVTITPQNRQAKITINA